MSGTGLLNADASRWRGGGGVILMWALDASEGGLPYKRPADNVLLFEWLVGQDLEFMSTVSELPRA